jgi:wingless-type MMTV integration site family, member 6
VNAITAAGIAYTIAKACSMGELVECSCDKNLVRHNVLLNNNQLTTFDNTKNSNNNKNRTKKPRRNGSNKRARNSNKKAQRKAPAPLPTDSTGLPAMGENWEWSGCDDNVNFGNRKSKDFLDARFRRRSDIKTLVKIHNNDAGRMVSYRLFCDLNIAVIAIDDQVS